MPFRAVFAFRGGKHDLYDIFCAVLYLMEGGCSWRAIPHDLPKWEMYDIIYFPTGSLSDHRSITTHSATVSAMTGRV